MSYHKRIICRMVLYFKLDARDRLWLLWSGSIRETPEGGGSPPNDSEDLHMGDLVRTPQHVTLRLEANHRCVINGLLSLMICAPTEE